MPDAYDRWLVPVMFRPYAVELAQRVADLEPARVLEVAAGTGVVTKKLLEALPHGTVTATDLNPAMVAVGSGRAPGPSGSRPTRSSSPSLTQSSSSSCASAG